MYIYISIKVSIYVYLYIYLYIYIIEDAYGDTPPPPASRLLSTAAAVDMEGVELFMKCKSLR